MATPNARTTTETTIEMPALAQKFREQLVSTLKQGQQLSIDAAQTWVNAMSVLPMADMPKIPGIPAMPGMETATKYTFDVASDLLSSQRDFALQLASALVPEKTV